MAEVQESIFPEIQAIRTPKVVRVLCECLGSVGSALSFLPSQPLASHGDHFVGGGIRDDANAVIN